MDGALAELIRIRDEGLADAVGLAAGRIDVMMPLLRDWDFDVLITHNRWTLVNRNAGPMLALAAERGIAVMNAAPYASGALAKGAGDRTLRLPDGATRRCWRRCGGSRRSARATGCRRGRWRCNSRCAIRRSPRRSAA